MRGRIVVAGSMAQKPRHGGHTWVFLQYLLGLERLGWEVLFIDRLEPEMCIDASGQPCPPAASLNLRYFRDVMERFGLGASYALFVHENGGGETAGRVEGRLERQEVLAWIGEAETLLNFMGFLDDEEILASARQRVFVDIDPGFGQMWHALGWADLFAGHDAFVTIGRNLGRPGCTIPDCGLDWITTHQPVVLEHWPASLPTDGPFTSIGTWRGRYAPIEYEGETYGLRAHEFRKFAEVPRLAGLSGSEFEIALDIDTTERADLELLAANGWTLVDPLDVASDPWAYRSYIAGSGAEFMVAKDLYVRSHSGWFSDRSICYLASGRPVVVQDTGFEGDVPSGEGLLAFRTLEEACAAVEEVSRDRLRHSRAARHVAEEHFDSDRVLTRLLELLGVASP